MKDISILIVDDQALIRDGLKTILELEKDIKVVGTCKNGVEAVKMTELLSPEVVLLDIRMPEMDGVEAVKIIKNNHPEIKVIMLTTFNDEEYIIAALAGGANGYLLKDTEIDKLLETIRAAVEGRLSIQNEVAIKLAEGLTKLNFIKKANKGLVEELDFSEREKEIASMMVQGFTNKQISAALYITEGTTRNYISNIYSKIDIGDRTRAVLYLKDKGIK
jgi:DNA-binding NarL/FixJ family response regulator